MSTNGTAGGVVRRPGGGVRRRPAGGVVRRTFAEPHGGEFARGGGRVPGQGGGDEGARVRATAAATRARDDKTFGATYLDGEHALRAIADYADEATADTYQKVRDVVRANTRRSEDVVLRWKPKTGVASVWVGTDAVHTPILLEPHPDGGIFVRGKRGRVIIPDGASDAEIDQLIRKVAGYKPATELAEFKPADHPRGQPGNAGQFGPGGGRAPKAPPKPAESPAKAPPENANPGEHATLAGARAWGEAHGVRLAESVSGTPVSRDQLNLVNAQIAKVPLKAAEAIHKAGSRLDVVGGHGITDHPSNAHLAGLTPRGWEGTGKTWDDVPGGSATKPGDATIIAARGLYATGVHGSANLVLHEHAHTADMCLGRASRQAEWLAVHKAAEWDSPYLRDYPEEGWAESFARYYHGGTWHGVPARAMVPAPVREYFDRLFGPPGGVTQHAEDAEGHEHDKEGKFTGKGGGGGKDVEIHDPKTGEVFWRGPRPEAEQMLREQAKDEPNHGLAIRDATTTREEDEAQERARREADEQARQTRIAEQERIAALATPKGFRPGHPNYVPPPPVLYHATFDADAIQSGGFKSSDELGKQTLGGTSSHLVSFTTRENAQTYRDAVNVGRLAARGELSDAQLVSSATRYGVTEEVARNLLRKAPTDPERRSFEFFQAVSFAGKKFPLFMGSRWPPHLKDAPPAEIVGVPSAGIKDIYYNPGEQEWRVGDYRGLTVQRGTAGENKW